MKKCPKCNHFYNGYNDFYCPKCNYRLIPVSKEEEYYKPQPNPNQPKCPTCQSTNIKKISDMSKLTHGLAFGLLSKTARSQFECKSCGYKW